MCLTLDIEMPRMDGLTFLKILQEHRPMPVIIVSSLTTAGSQFAMRAMELGAVDVVAKQSSAWNIGSLREQLAHRVKGAARARLSLLRPDGSGEQRDGKRRWHPIFRRANWWSLAPPPAAPKPSKMF